MFKILEHLHGMVDFRVQPIYAMQFIGLQTVEGNNVLHVLTTYLIRRLSGRVFDLRSRSCGRGLRASSGITALCP